MLILSISIIFLISGVLSMTLWGILNFSIWWTEMIVFGDHHLILALFAIALMIGSAATLELLAPKDGSRSHR